MNIVDLTPEYHNTYFHCLEEYSDDMKEAGDNKACWYHKLEQKGLRVKLALDDDGAAVGMIQYLPIEESYIEGTGLYFIPCIWVHGHAGGPGNRQGKGIGTALLQAAENDALELGARGMAAWGLWLPIWMKASWYKKHGYKKADRDSISVLIWKTFTNDAARPRWIRQKKRVPAGDNKVTVTAFHNGWCQVRNIVFERAKRACADLGDSVRFESIDTSDRETFLEWGISDGIFINGKKVNYGPPLAYEKLRKLIAKRM
jgi:GNAT superfamily N-acetyltransferase